LETAHLIGRVVAEASAQVHVHGDADNGLLWLRLDFDDGTGVRFGSASDGQSLRVDDQRLQSDDMVEYGRSEVRAFTGLATGEALREVVQLVDRDDLTFGVLLGTATSRLFVFNWGDELHAESRLPEAVRIEAGGPLPQ
jgi:hypothetical protein